MEVLFTQNPVWIMAIIFFFCLIAMRIAIASCEEFLNSPGWPGKLAMISMVTATGGTVLAALGLGYALGL